MPTVVTPTESHAERQQKSYSNLDHARGLAARTLGYDSQTTRQNLHEACLERCNHAPYLWQLDVAEAFNLGLDCVILAGTGFGKSLPFIMPLMLNPEKILLVITPLNSLEEDQARRASKIGLRAVAVNHVTYTDQLHRELEMTQFRVIYTSPEMAISNRRFNDLLCSSAYQKNLLGVVIDEAHCILQWGGDFRPTYAKLDKLRSFVPSEIPIYITTATMTPDMLMDVQRTLHINPSTAFTLNLGNDRPNIFQEVRIIRNSRDFAALDYLFEEANRAEDLERALLFVNRVEDAQLGWQRSRRMLPAHLRQFVGFLHSRRSEGSKVSELEMFRQGERRILWVTEVGGMGLDIPDIALAVQLGAPPSLTVWIQRAGRAGRASNIRARAILCIESSALKVVGRARTGGDESAESEPEGGDNDAPEEKTYRKKLGSCLREYVETNSCRRKVVDELFNNPPRDRLALPSDCCDNCAISIVAAPTESGPAAMEEESEGEEVVVPKQEAQPVSRRAQQHLQAVRSALVSWRVQTLARDFPFSCFTSSVILPDPVLTSIASNRHLVTLDHLRNDLSTRWEFVEDYGAQVLDMVKKMDDEENQRKEAKRLADQEAKRIERERKKADKAASGEKSRRARLLHHAKENCNIPGTGCFDALESYNDPKVLPPDSPPTTPRPLRLPLSPIKSHPRDASPSNANVSSTNAVPPFNIYTPSYPPPSPDSKRQDHSTPLSPRSNTRAFASVPISAPAAFDVYTPDFPPPSLDSNKRAFLRTPSGSEYISQTLVLDLSRQQRKRARVETPAA